MKTFCSALLFAVLILTGCNQSAPAELTPLQEYHIAIEVHEHELTLKDRLTELGADANKLEEQQKRIDRALKYVRKAEARLE